MERQRFTARASSTRKAQGDAIRIERERQERHKSSAQTPCDPTLRTNSRHFQAKIVCDKAGLAGRVP
jgi:hypothetical protein